MDDHRAKDPHKSTIDKAVNDARNQMRRVPGARVELRAQHGVVLSGDWIDDRLNTVVVYDSPDGDVVVATVPTASVVAVSVCTPARETSMIPPVRRDLAIRAAIVMTIAATHGPTGVVDALGGDEELGRRVMRLPEAEGAHRWSVIDATVDETVDRLSTLLTRPWHATTTVGFALETIRRTPVQRTDGDDASPLSRAMAAVTKIGPHAPSTQLDALPEDARTAILARLALGRVVEEFRARFRPYMDMDELMADMAGIATPRSD